MSLPVMDSTTPPALHHPQTAPPESITPLQQHQLPMNNTTQSSPDSTTPGQHHPPTRQRHSSPRTAPPPSTSGRYVSYWNAFLFYLKLNYIGFIDPWQLFDSNISFQTIPIDLLPPATNLRRGYVFFTPVCHFVHRGGVSVPACTTGHITGGSRSRGSLSGGPLSGRSPR